MERKILLELAEKRMILSTVLFVDQCSITILGISLYISLIGYRMIGNIGNIAAGILMIIGTYIKRKGKIPDIKILYMSKIIVAIVLICYSLFSIFQQLIGIN